MNIINHVFIIINIKNKNKNSLYTDKNSIIKVIF